MQTATDLSWDVDPLPVTGIVAEIAARPAIRQQLGSRPYAELIALAERPDTAVLTSIWVESLFLPTLALLADECPDYRAHIAAMRAGVRRNTYTGPRVKPRASFIHGRCGDNAVVTGPDTADCQTCGTIGRPRQR